MKAIYGVLHIILRPVDVVVADEAVVVLKFWIVEKRVPAILLHVLFPNGDMKFVLVKFL